jgi:hypothetical protein
MQEKEGRTEGRPAGRQRREPAIEKLTQLKTRNLTN